ncbi:PWI-domain-containing protein, partial [Meira miltonrushii]
MTKVNMEVIRPWIAEKVEEVLGFEDDVVVEYVNGMLEDPNDTQPDPKKMQLSLTGFLESKTPTFMAELWSLLLSAQKSIGGIPQDFVEKKKQEMRLARERDAAAIAGSGLSRRQEGRSYDRQGDQQQGRSRFEDRSNRSRWDDAPRSRNSGRNDFVDRRGNRTERIQDSGWGAQRSYDSRPRRSPSPPRNRNRSRTRSRSPPRYERQEKRSRYFDNADSNEGSDQRRRRYEHHDDERRNYDRRERESPPRRNVSRRSPESSPSRSPEARQSSSKRQAEGSVTPDYRDRQRHRPSPSLTPPRRRDDRSPTYSPPGAQWDDEKSDDDHPKEEGPLHRKDAHKLSRSRWAND